MKDHYCFFPPKRVIKVSLTSERNTIITLHSSVILFYFIQSHLNFVFLKEKERASLKGHGDGAGVAKGLGPSRESGCAGLCRAEQGSAGLCGAVRDSLHVSTVGHTWMCPPAHCRLLAQTRSSTALHTHAIEEEKQPHRHKQKWVQV